MAENFNLIFGQSASSQYEWNDSDYQNGWGTVGSTPPTAEQFDALQRRNDKKAQELNSALTPLVNQNTASNRQPLTAYALKDIRYSSLLPTGWYLECTTAGTSASADITLPTPLVENATITDGTCVWKVRKISSENELGNKADRSLSNLTDAGKSFSFPSDTFVNVSNSLTWTTSDNVNYQATYTVPANGYINVAGVVNTSALGYVDLFVKNSDVTALANNNSSTIQGTQLFNFIPVPKGDTVLFVIGHFTVQSAAFYYANGEVPTP